jgi:hypothetical protein
MLQWLQWIETFSAINPYLPGVIKFGVGALVMLGVLIPVSIVATVLDSASKVAITQLLSYLKTLSSRLYDGIASHVVFCAEILNKFIADNSVKYGFNPDLANAEVAKAQGVIDNIEEHGRSFPGIIESRLSPISDRYADFEDRLQEIEGMKLEPMNLDIPDVEILDQDINDRSKGLTNLFIFVPLAAFMLIINTFLLHLFFDNMGIDVTIIRLIRINLSHVLAFIFSSIELGVGAYVAFAEFKKPKLDDRIDVYKSMAWMVFIILAMIEGFIYLQLSLSLSPEQIWLSKKPVFQLLFEGWMLLFGPLIVTALFLFGHKVTEGYLLFRSVINVKRLKRELDDAHNKSIATNKAIINYNSQLKEVIQKLKDYRIALRESPDTILPESEFLSDLETRVSNAREVLESFSSIREGSQATIVTEVNQEEVRKVFYQMVFYAILMAISVAASTFVMVPLLEEYPELKKLPRFAIICIPIFGQLAVAAIGYLWSNQFTMQVGNDIIAHQSSTFIRMALGLSAGVLLTLVVYITGISPKPPAYESLLIICGSMAIAMWIGPSLRVVLAAVVALTRLLWRAILIVLRWITASIALAIFYLVTWVQSLLQFLAFPGRRFYEMIFT